MSKLFVDLPYPLATFVELFAMFATLVGFGKLGDEVYPDNPVLGKLKTYFRNSVGVRTFARAYIASIFVMDVLYGRRILSVRAALVSTMTSCTWIAILVGSTVLAVGRRAWVFDAAFAGEVLTSFWGFMVVGIVVDYLAICAARIVLRNLAGRRAWAVLASITVASAFVALVFYICYDSTKSIFLGQRMENPVREIMLWLSSPTQLMFSFQTLNDWHFTQTAPGVYKILDGNSVVVYAFPEGLLFLSSQFTLIWLTLHMFAHWLYFGGFRVSKWARTLVDYAEFDKRPLQSSAMVTALLALPPTWVAMQVLRYS